MSSKRVSLGELRPSQLLHTYGVGAVVDLPHMSVMVMGLEDWDHDRCRPVREDRLLAEVQKRLNAPVERLATPPIDDSEGLMRAFGDSEAVGVPVAPFPRWMRCPACHILAPLSAALFQLKTVPGRPDKARYVHTSCNQRRSPPVLPARFLLACESGHLDDFPWRYFVHRGASECSGVLELREHGVAGEASEVEAQCRACGQKRRMVDAFGKEGQSSLPGCRGRRPHLRDFEDEPCSAARQTILLGASNSWFPVTLSALHVPASADEEIDRLVEDRWDTLGDVEERAVVAFLRKQGQLGPIAGYDDAAIWQAIERRRGGMLADAGDGGDIKAPEWRVFVAADPARKNADFELREVPAPREQAPLISRVLLVERMREVTALLGFTRIASPRDYAEDAEIPSRVRAPISRQPPRSVPASEVRGEGIFVHFDEQRLHEWSTQQGELEDRFYRAHGAWRRRRHIEPPEAGFPGIRYIALHSFAHALMRELALECGYTAASLRERIYARDDEPKGPPMAGVLIYTAAPDSEGTLGGLVSMGEPQALGRHIARALEHIRLCSSDPLCASHEPEPDGTTLHGAVCHACLFAPETSCERGNKYLDRGVLVGTLGRAGSALFEA